MLKKVLLGCFAIATTLVYGQELSCAQVTALANQYFSGPDVVNNMVCISYYESSFNASALNPSGATGLWQIMEGHCDPGSICTGICSSQEDLYNPSINAQCAVAVYNAQGYDAWTTYADGDCNSWVGCSSASSGNSNNSGGSQSGNSNNSGSSQSGSSNSGSGNSNSGSGSSNSGSGTGTGSGSGSQQIKGGYFDTGSSASSSSTGIPV